MWPGMAVWSYSVKNNNMDDTGIKHKINMRTGDFSYIAS